MASLSHKNWGCEGEVNKMKKTYSSRSPRRKCVLLEILRMLGWDFVCDIKLRRFF